MISTNLSTCLTVEDFFIQANWQGRKIEPSPLSSSPSIETMEIDTGKPPSLNSSLADFFALNNWQGVKRVITYSTSQDEQALSSITSNFNAEPSFTATVSQFLQKIVWKGQKQVKIGAEPEMAKQQIDNPQSQSLNIKDLSDLF